MALWIGRFANPTLGDLLLGAVLLGLIVAGVLAVFVSFRSGAYTVALLVAALGVLRLLPGRWGQLFVVRGSRFADTTTMLILSAGIAVLAHLVSGGR